MPRVAERMYEIMRTIGVPAVDWPIGFQFQFLPLLSLPFRFLTGKDEAEVRLDDEAHLDAEKLEYIVDFVCTARNKAREIAGTVDQALDFARNRMPWDPGSIYTVPVGYRLIGRLQDCDNYLTDCRVQLRSKNNPAFLELYDRFADQLRKLTW